MWVCATPATWNEGGCHQVTRLPRTQPQRHRRQIRTKRATQCHKCHACHAKRRGMCEMKVDVTKCHACHAKGRGVTGDKSGPSPPPNAISATPAMQNEVGCEFVRRLPREMNVDVTKCHACHAKGRGVTGDKSGPSAPPSHISATPATQNEGGCEFVPRLPCEMKVDVTKCHACHTKGSGVTGDKPGPSAPPSHISATPATQNEGMP